MQKRLFIAGVIMVLFLQANLIYGAPGNYRGKKILYVNSYHQGYEWSDGEQRGAENILAGTGVELKEIYMDTKNNTSEEFCRDSGLKIKKYIEEFKPDVLITSDDNAFIYVVMPYYRDADLPVVFCGINWDISTYGGQYKNSTGMLEVALIGQIYNHLKRFSKGDRVGFLGFDAPHERRNVEYYDQFIKNGSCQKVFVKDFSSWKEKFLELQKESDMIILGSSDGIKGWAQQEAVNFMYEHVMVPVGSDMPNMTPLCLVGLVKSAEEQGEYAARAALRILDGEKPSGIPVVANKRGDLILNLKIAGNLGIVFTPSMFKSAKEIIDPGQ